MARRTDRGRRCPALPHLRARADFGRALAAGGAAYPARIMSQAPSASGKRPLLLALGVGVAIVAAVVPMLVILSASDMAGKPLLPDPYAVWTAAPFATPPVVAADDLWLSLPARTADGAVFGLVRGKDGRAFVKLDEATGRATWRTAAGSMFASAERSDGWRGGETFPAVPQSTAGEREFLVVWQREWALVSRTNGELSKSGAFPDNVPPASPAGGVCLVDDAFWIAIEDGRDGGIMLGADGQLATTRSDRPATCLPTTTMRFEEGARSPAQHARASAQPVPPMCNETRRGRVIREGAYCNDLRSDGPPEHAAMIHFSDLALRDGGGWLRVEPPRSAEFSSFIFGFELAWPRVFVDLGAARKVTVQNQPSATSFEAKRVETQRQAVEYVVGVGRKGEVLWLHSIYNGPFSESSQVHGNHRSQVAQHRSLLLASHPDSPTKNLYIFKPGVLLAVDQETGAARFQLGAALPLPK